MRLSTLLLVLGIPLAAQPQWSTDPSTPMVVCNATGNQGIPCVVDDDQGGWYVFWSDPRVSSTQKELYGQHYDAEGMAQWEANGRQVLSLPWTSLNEVAAVRISDGHVMLAILSKVNSGGGSDTVRAFLIDNQAQQLWSEPALLSVSGPGIFGNCFGFSNPQGIASGDGAYFCYSGDSQGSNGYYVMQRIRADGTVDFTVPGKQVPYNAGYGPFKILPDGAEGMVVGWRCSNGGGTCHRATRVDSEGNATWPANLEVSAGGAGLTYEFRMAADGAGGFVSVWEENSDLGMTRFDTTGTILWSPSPSYACTESHTQSSPALVFNDGSLYVAWKDNRPPANNADLYLQRVDTSDGSLQWNADGVLTIHENSYIPSASIVASDSGCVIAMMDFNLGTKYSAMRMRPDGTTAWPAPISFTTGTQPFYDDRVQLPDGDGGVVAFWRSQPGDIYGARIYRNGLYYNNVGIGVHEEAHLTIAPNPAIEQVVITAPQKTSISLIRLFDMHGREVQITPRRVGDRTVVPVGHLAPGCYIVTAWSENGNLQQRLIIE